MDHPTLTGWPPPKLAQDDCRGLFRWFASKPDARRLVRERCEEIRQELERARVQNYTEEQLAEIKRLHPICEDEETATIFQWQLTDLMAGLGSSEDHEDVKAELRKLPLTENCVNLLHAIIVNSLKGLK